jgi:hypothetical protein
VPIALQRAAILAFVATLIILRQEPAYLVMLGLLWLTREPKKKVITTEAQTLLELMLHAQQERDKQHAELNAQQQPKK